MAVFVIEFLAVLVFWKAADFTRAREFFPVVIAGTFERFLEHFIIVDWLGFFKIHGSMWLSLWSPISADVTIWVVTCYLFIQYLPNTRRVLYGLVWVAVMLLYLKILIWLDVFSMVKGWNMGISFCVLCFYFLVLYFLWVWLNKRQGQVGGA